MVREPHLAVFPVVCAERKLRRENVEELVCMLPDSLTESDNAFFLETVVSCLSK